MKRILGLDLGTTSIGWAYVLEDPSFVNSEILKTGVRLIPINKDEKKEFSTGKKVSTNAGRTEKRGARRNNFRYKLRRKNLIDFFTKKEFITSDTVLTENGKHKRFELLRLRSKGAKEKLSKVELVRVLLAINKSRGYRSNRKANASDEGDGALIDNLAVADYLKLNSITPGILGNEKLENNEKLPTFYKSDILNEFERIWEIQSSFYKGVLTDEVKSQITNANPKDIISIFEKTLNVKVIEVKGKRQEKERATYAYRAQSANEVIDLEALGLVIRAIKFDLIRSNSYLAQISNLNKILHENQWTVGEYLYKLIKENPNESIKNKVFLRSDYVKEFDTIWNTQQSFHPELTDELKNEVKNRIIFYQRRLKSQKHLVSKCKHEPDRKVIPRSAPLFQWFRIWQSINHLELSNLVNGENYHIDLDDKIRIFNELNITRELSDKQILKILGKNNREWSLNFEKLKGNTFQSSLMEIALAFCEEKGLKLNRLKSQPETILTKVESKLNEYGITLPFMTLENMNRIEEVESHPQYRLWHLLYSYEEDNTNSGQGKLIERLMREYGVEKSLALKISNIPCLDDYGSLSAKAIKKIMVGLLDGLVFSDAVTMAGYRHSFFETAEERDTRQLAVQLAPIAKNSLRNPVVEKVISQMINVVNAILADPSLGAPDEIRIEVGRDLKMSQKQRENTTKRIAEKTKEHEEIREILREEFNLKYISRNDIIRYKLYKELETNGFQTLYTSQYIDKGKLFTNQVDIEHIIPQSLMFDDSFSNKTLSLRKENQDKGNKTGIDFVATFGEEAVAAYKQRVLSLYPGQSRLTKKQRHLLMKRTEIPKDFLNRDLGNTQYIAKAAMDKLREVCRVITPTTGKITQRLRQDWRLINVLKELNWETYHQAGLTTQREGKNGQTRNDIINWDKRKDHRHHAMDAIAVAFTNPAIIQYLNGLNAKTQLNHGIKEKYTYSDNGRLRFRSPIPNMRNIARRSLENIFVSRKAKNKVLSRNQNKIKKRNGYNNKIEYTPRGPLHKETVYGKIQRYVTKEEKITSKFDEDKINMVAKKAFRLALLKRLKEFGGDSKKSIYGEK